MTLLKNPKVRGFFVMAASLVIAAASVALLVMNLNNSGFVEYAVHMEYIEYAMTAVLLLISVYIIYAGARDKKYHAVVLAIVQILATVGSELLFGGKAEAANALMLDNLSLLMVMLVGVVGSLICVFSVGYMEKYHHHKHVADRSRMFFAVVFVFMSAMFGLVLSNNLKWLLFFWEITTFCSYLLIGYTRTAEAIRNSYRALVMNIVGGLGFLAGIVWLYETQGIIEVDKLLALNPALVVVPVVFICFAGVVKSAQMPFSSWLLGAMVAPSPVSALLHSSTMVKAGVYIVIRLSPLLAGTKAGLFIALIGAVTFLFASLIAISERNLKRLLAYSTISTLGLIVACAGVGTYQAVWTAMLLMIFHAVAKALLFLCAGTVEGGTDSLSIEDMDGLIMKMPKVTVFILVGIAGMFLAPFGMLISKWQALEALVSVNPLIAVLVIFGSSATLFFYTKLMGKLIMIVHPAGKLEKGVTGGEWFTLGTLSILTVAACVVFPVISKYLIDPFIKLVYHSTVSMSAGNIVIMLLMMVFLLLLPLQIVLQRRDKRHVSAYLNGANLTEYKDAAEANDHFYTAGHNVQELKLSNYYLEEMFGEKRLGLVGIVLTSMLLAILCGVMFL
ncbi:NADH-quinone oxidoreductase subunit L [Sporobacter termitidis]|nr:proton-conducting transporter membrane subunit [Sporobacter termitidis]